jgi:hypothetical protein
MMGLSLREDSLGAWFSVGLRPESQKVVATKGFWVLCVDVFRESLESGLVLSRRRGGWEFLLGLCAHHGWLYLCYGMALSLTLSLSLFGDKTTI